MSMTAQEIETWMRQTIATALGVYVDEVDLETKFDELGLDSVNSLELIGALEEKLDRAVSPRVMEKHRTIRALAAHLASG